MGGPPHWSAVDLRSRNALPTRILHAVCLAFLPHPPGLGKEVEDRGCRMYVRCRRLVEFAGGRLSRPGSVMRPMRCAALPRVRNSSPRRAPRTVYSDSVRSSWIGQKNGRTRPVLGRDQCTYMARDQNMLGVVPV